MPLPLLRCLVFRVFLFLELATLDVACVEFRVMFPLFGKIIQRKNRGDRADGHACTAIDTLDRIDVELRDFFEARSAVVVGCVLLGVDAIYGAGIDAGGIFCLCLFVQQLFSNLYRNHCARRSPNLRRFAPCCK